MKVRSIFWAAALVVGGCSVREAAAPHPAVTAGADVTEELRLSFFAGFDARSFRALAERAFTDPDPAAREPAARLLDDVVWNWHPELPDLAARRRRARLLLLSLLSHPDARVRTGTWRLARFTFDDPAAAAPVSEAFAEALGDPDPDARRAALRTALDFHAGHTGGCVIGPKKTSFTLRVHADRLSERLFVEPDPRVRGLLLRALAWCGRKDRLPLFARYFTEADRRDEVPAIGWTLLDLFALPETGLESEATRPHGPPGEAWARFRAFADSLAGSQAARRNGIALVLHLASESSTSIHADRGLLRRVIDLLERDEESLREEDLHLVVDHWRVMDPSDVILELQGTLRRSCVPALVASLRDLLVSDP